MLPAAIFQAAIFLTACSAALQTEGETVTEPVSTALPSDEGAETQPPTPTVEAEPEEGIGPLEATSETPAINRRVPVEDDIRFPFLLPFDGIRPVYNPEFSPADEAPLRDSELVIGIALDGEVKAYPITVLRFREMVNDELGGIPILVTW